MLFRIDFEVGIYPDRIQICDRRTGRFVDYAAEVPFSAPGRLIGDTVYFENALAKATRKALSGGFILLDAQARISVGGGALAPADRGAIRHALREIGFKALCFDGDEAEEYAPMPPIPAMLTALL